MHGENHTIFDDFATTRSVISLLRLICPNSMESQHGQSRIAGSLGSKTRKGIRRRKVPGKCAAARESGSCNARVVRVALGAIHVWNFRCVCHHGAMRASTGECASLAHDVRSPAVQSHPPASIKCFCTRPRRGSDLSSRLPRWSPGAELSESGIRGQSL